MENRRGEGIPRGGDPPRLAWVPILSSVTLALSAPRGWPGQG